MQATRDAGRLRLQASLAAAVAAQHAQRTPLPPLPILRTAGGLQSLGPRPVPAASAAVAAAHLGGSSATTGPQLLTRTSKVGSYWGSQLPLFYGRTGRTLPFSDWAIADLCSIASAAAEPERSSATLPFVAPQVTGNLAVGVQGGGPRQALQALVLPAPKPVPRFKSWEHVRKNVHDPREVG